MRSAAASLVFGAAGAVVAMVDAPMIGAVAALVGAVCSGIIGIGTLVLKRQELKRVAPPDPWEKIALDLLAERAARHDA